MIGAFSTLPLWRDLRGSPTCGTLWHIEGRLTVLRFGTVIRQEVNTKDSMYSQIPRDWRN